jgi:hypothetical protein
MKIEYDTAARDVGCADPAPLSCGVERGAIVRQFRGEGAIAEESTQRGRMSASGPELPSAQPEPPITVRHPSPVALHICAYHVEVRFASPARLLFERRSACQR